MPSPFRPVRAATALTVWAAARRGGTSADTVLEVLADIGGRVRAATETIAQRTGLPGPGENGAGPMELLTLVRTGGRPGLLLPRPGDVRGLPTTGPVGPAALAVGAAVVLPDLELTLVPVDGSWRVHDGLAAVHPALSYELARTELDEAVAAATTILRRAELARDDAGARAAIAEVMIAERVDLPPAIPARAGTLLATAISLDAVLQVSAGHDPAALTSGHHELFDSALRPLTDAVREARRTAVEIAVKALERPDNSGHHR